MIVTYRMFQEENEQHTFRELFCERDGRIIAYGKAPIAPRGGSARELTQELTQLQEAAVLPILTISEVEAAIAAQTVKTKQGRKTISHADLIKKLGLATERESKANDIMAVTPTILNSSKN